VPTADAEGDAQAGGETMKIENGPLNGMVVSLPFDAADGCEFIIHGLDGDRIYRYDAASDTFRYEGVRP
jgi:hypothetical protein